MFDNKKLRYAIIVIGNTKIAGECSYWELATPGYIKLIVNGKEFLTSTQNVILCEERP